MVEEKLLFVENIKIFIICKGGNGTLSTIRREMMFINLLEGLHPKEAEVLILTKDKKLTDKYKISLKMLKRHIPIFNGVVVHDSSCWRREKMAEYSENQKNVLPHEYGCEILLEKTTL
jgi:hypothetical protein